MRSANCRLPGAFNESAGARTVNGVPEAPWSLALASKIALDEIFFATELASAAVVPLRQGRRVVAEMEQALDLFEQRGWLADPRRYHPKPPALSRVRISAGRFPGLAYRQLRFESDYEPHAGEPGRERWLGYAANRTAFAWLLQHRNALALALARAVTNLELKRLIGIGAGRWAVTIQKTVSVAAPIEEVFDFWSRYENFPRFMAHVRDVRRTPGGRAWWTVAGPAGVPVEVGPSAPCPRTGGRRPARR